MGEGNYLDVDGNKIYYEKHGSGEKIIVLLPGVLGKLIKVNCFIFFIPEINLLLKTT